MWRDGIQAFSEALVDPARPVPADLAGDPRRFDVYRNNVAVASRDALAETLPVVTALVGEEFAAAMAVAFVDRFPPTSPVLIGYGARFADFVAGFPPAASLPYLADVARLEWAWHEAYHAADVRPVPIDCLKGIADEAPDDWRLVFHPSTRLMRSAWPVVSIWHAHQDGGSIESLADLPNAGEQALVVRPHLEVEVRPLSPGAFAFTHLLVGGMALGDAIETITAWEDIDAGNCLAALFETGAVAGISRLS